MNAIHGGRAIRIKTPLGEDVLLFYRMNGYERLSELFEYEIELLSENHAIQPESLLGENITVGLRLQDGERFFNGYVTRFGQYGSLDIYSYYRATVRPWLWFLSRQANCRIFHGKTTLEIVEAILSEYKFSGEMQKRLSSQYPPREYCVQYRETDFNFVSRLLEEEGIYYYFSHANGKHHLVLADAAAGHDPFPGYATILYHPEESDTDKAREDHIYNWGFAREVQTGRYALKDYDFTRSAVPLEGVSVGQERHPKHGGYGFFDYAALYTDLDSGKFTGKLDDIVKRRLEEQQARYERCEGAGNARGLAAGCLFTLRDHPRGDQNRQYLIVSASYRLHNDAYLPSMSAGAERTFECGFSAQDKAIPYRPPRATPKPLVHGTQTAIVVGGEGKEIDPDKYGRVKVRFHWDSRYTLGDCCWVRVAQPWAGNGWGMVALPRVGQEVVVDFLEGDPDRPLITGRVYNNKSELPYALPDHAHLSTIKTDSTPGGGGFNELRFNDKKGEEQVFLHAQNSLDVRVKGSEREWVGGERHLIVKKDRFEQVEGEHHSSVKGNSSAAVEGDFSLTVQQDHQEKTGMNYALDAGAAIHLKAGMNVVIEAGASITLKAGGGFIVVGPAGVTISGTPVLINSGGAAGAGAGASPQKPKDAKPAAEAKPGKPDEPAPPPKPPKPAAYGPSATVLKLAALNGTPFCEICQGGA